MIGNGFTTKMGNMYVMTDEERSEIRKLIENEQAEGAMRDCIAEYRRMHMPMSMQLRGYYESLINVGFSHADAMDLVIDMIHCGIAKG